MGMQLSAGVSVTVKDDSFYIPAQATTVPLIFVATRGNKKQPDGVSVAAGTNEFGVVRAVSSLTQSMQLFGIPHFVTSNIDEAHHGDARNEYGILALNQFLGIGSRAYTVRANIDLDDDEVSFISLGVPKAGSSTFYGMGNGTLTGIVVQTADVRPQRITITFSSESTYSVMGSKDGLLGVGTLSSSSSNIPLTGSFDTNIVEFTLTAGSSSFSAGDKFIFDIAYEGVAALTNTGNGKLTSLVPDVNAVNEEITIVFTSATEYTVSNIAGAYGSGIVGIPYDDSRINFTITAGSTAFVPGDSFSIAAESVTLSNPLGVNDRARRLKIVKALNAAIASNVDIRSDSYEFNLILCPGYPETSDAMVSLARNYFKEEAMVIGDTPAGLTPEQTAVWALSGSSSTIASAEGVARSKSSLISYYYPWGLTTNLDGAEVVCAPSGIALSTIAYSDDQAYVWQAPAGVARGTVVGISAVGYVSGTFGEATTFVEVRLNEGQRGMLYQDDQKINPIVKFASLGLVIWGNKTSYGAASARDRINVERMIMFVRRALRKAGMPFVFEPNDQITRDNLKAMVDGFLNDILVKRGLMDYATVCDESNNDGTRIDRNELWIDVALKPMKSAEFIYIPISIVNSSASF